MRTRPALLVVVVLLLAVGGGAVAWTLFLKGDNVAPLALPSRAPAASTGTAAASTTPGSSGATTSLPLTGSATIASSGGTLTLAAAEFSVDMTTLQSDRSMRDNRLRNDGIETDSFPTSTFKLTSPVEVPAAATTGAQVDVTLKGNLTLHGVTKAVEIPAKAQLNGNLIQVVGSLDFPFSDFSINAPNIGGFVAVEDHGTLEFLVNLTKS